MEANSLLNYVNENLPVSARKPAIHRPTKSDQLFQAILANKVASPPARPAGPLLNRDFLGASNEPPTYQAPDPAALNAAAAANAYQLRKPPAAKPADNRSDWQKYKDDQLLSNPGGDRYHTVDGSRLPPGKESFFSRIGKDLADAFGNVKNFFGNLLFGAKVRYRDEHGEIQETRQKGLVGSILELAKDLASALSFGAWRPDGEPAPQGLGAKVKFTGNKLKEALGTDLIEGVGGSLNHLTEDLVLAGWNLLEVVPDATIGNFKAGRELTTKIFDNGQVAVDYLTDTMPFGEAWLRVHASKKGDLPVMHNLKLPENHTGDERWAHIRNTPLRKNIETIGSLLADIISIGLATKVVYPGDKRN